MFDETSEVKYIRNLLKNSWVPFFSRYGRLTQIQRLAIPKILEGKNVVVSSPTATGKTEAVVAPVAEIAQREKWQGLSILYIVPTRALANDVLVRLEGPLREMGFKTSLKHGDKPYISAQNPPNFLITTPESLDSLICRYPGLFRELKTVIMDEIHSLDNTYRGDQLRVLLRRLKRNSSHPEQLRFHLLSATLFAPAEIASRYVEEFEVVRVEEKAKIEYHFVDSVEGLYKLARVKGWRKMLCFCNMREEVENFGAYLEKIWKPYPVVTHHGSLSREKREEAENVMRESDVAVCVATSTLELGIDIGNIDCVALLKPPWSISSLVQRIGRGNRRTGLLKAVALVKSDEERELLESMFTIASEGLLPTSPYSPDLSVGVQQIFSLLYSHPLGLSEEELCYYLSPICSQEQTHLILRELLKREWVEMRAGFYHASTKLMNLGEQGRIHSNIPDEPSFTVIDVVSGKEIGRIAGIFDKTFLLAGKIWMVVAVEGKSIYAKQVKKEAFTPVFYRYSLVGAFFHLLPSPLKEKLLESLKAKTEVI